MRKGEISYREYKLMVSILPSLSRYLDELFLYILQNQKKINEVVFKDNSLSEQKFNEELKKAEEHINKKKSMLHNIEMMNYDMHPDDKRYADENHSFEYIKEQYDFLKQIKSDKEFYLHRIKDYGDDIDLSELPKYSNKSSCKHLKSVYKIAYSNKNRLFELKNEIRKWMSIKDMTYKDLGSDIKYYDSKSVHDKESLLYIVQNYNPYGKYYR